MFKTLYYSLVLDIITYGAGKLGIKESSVIQNSAWRFFLGVGKYSPNAAVNGDMG